VKAVIVGGGGHARSVLEAIRSAGELEPVGFTDPRTELAGAEIDGVPVIGDDSELDTLRDNGVEVACIGLGGRDDNRPRAELYARVRELGFALPPVLHVSATIASTAEVGDGSVVLAGAVLGAGVQLGEDVIVNNGAVAEHDCALGSHVHLSSGAALGGAVRAGEGAHIGLGASVLGGVEIGDWAVVGAGAVVLREVAARSTVAGVPAEPLG
jgi:UDP-perosamine 4-acetyltransferase